MPASYLAICPVNDKHKLIPEQHSRISQKRSLSSGLTRKFEAISLFIFEKPFLTVSCLLISEFLFYPPISDSNFLQLGYAQLARLLCFSVNLPACMQRESKKKQAEIISGR